MEGEAFEDHPLFLELAKFARPLLGLRKLPNRCYFVVAELNGKKLSRGEIVTPADAHSVAKLGDRYKTLLATFKKDPKPDLPEEDGPAGEPLLNLLCGRAVSCRPDRLEAMRKRKEVFSSRVKYVDGDLRRALLLGENDVDKAVRALQGMKRSEDNLVSKRGGHATRAGVRHALQVRVAGEGRERRAGVRHALQVRVAGEWRERGGRRGRERGGRRGRECATRRR